MKNLILLTLALGLVSCTPNNNPDLQIEFDHKFDEAIHELELNSFMPDLEPLEYDQYKSIKLPKEVKRHIPKGYYVLDILNGDINKDSITDIILVAAKTDKQNWDGAPRPLYIFTGTRDNGYVLAAENYSAIIPYDCGGMLKETYITINTSPYGYFSLVHYGGSGANKWVRQDFFYWSEISRAWHFLLTQFESYQMERHLNYNKSIQCGSDNDFLLFSEFSQDNCS